MSQDGTGTHQGVREDEGARRPLAVARTAVARAADELRRVVDGIDAAERDGERGETRIREANERAAAVEAAAAVEWRRGAEAERRLADVIQRAEAEERLEIEMALAGERYRRQHHRPSRTMPRARTSSSRTQASACPPRFAGALLDPAQLLRSGAPKGGTGLILMSRRAQIHRGRATVEEHPGGGAGFRVFPTMSVEAGADVPPAHAGARPTLEDGAIAI